MGRKREKRESGAQQEENVTGKIQPAFFFLWPLLALFAILTTGLLAYSDTFSVPFVLDDVTSVLVNPLVKDFAFHLKSRIIGDLSFALNYRLHGFELAGYHAVNLSLHLINACLVYLLTSLLFHTPLLSGYGYTSLPTWPSAAKAIPFAAAIIFVSHPLQTQAVTYIAQRVAVMATTFYLGSLISYLGSRLSTSRLKSIMLLVLSLLLAAAGVLSKENAVTLPVAALFLEMTFFRGGITKRLFAFGWSLALLAFLPLLIIARIGYSPDILSELGRMTAEQGAPQRLTYFLTQFPVIVSYLRLFLLPVRQNLDHDIALRSSLADPVVAGGLLILLLVAAVGCRLWVRGRRVDAGDERWKVLAAFGIGWFFITLAVESTLIPIRDVMFEHRLYLPSVGLVMATAAAGWGAAGRYLSESRRIPVFIAIFVLLGTVLGSTTFLRNRVWKDEVTLWRDIVEKSPRKARAHGSLGHALQRSGNAEEAARSYLYAVKLTPEDFIARNNLGTLYLNSGHPELALEQFEAALRASPAKAMINFNRGLALEKIGRLVEAEAAYDNAVRIDRENDRALNNLGILQYRNGNRQAAAESFRQALRINPTNKQASENLASIERAEKKDAK